MISRFFPAVSTAGNPIFVDGSLKRALEVGRSRLVFVTVILLLCFCTIGLRLIEITVTGLGEEGESFSFSNRSVSTELRTNRADVLDRQGELLATNLKTASLYANPQDILNVEDVTAELHAMFPDLSAKELREKLSRKNLEFIWLKRNLHPAQQSAINELGQPGLYFWDEEKRFYPYGDIASHALGFVGIDGKGLSGVERFYNNRLEQGAGQDKIPMVLTLDVRVQDILRQELLATFKKHSALGGAGLIMDANNGEVLSMVSLPDFDPNLPSKLTKDQEMNRAALGVYEMGSTFKAFTMAYALESGKVGMHSVYDATDPIKIARFRISDYHPEKRPLTVPEIFLHSSNIGTAKIADQLGVEVQRDFFQKLGLLAPLSFDLYEVGAPLVPANWSRITTMTASYGHGLAVSPLHMMRAYAALVNGGRLVQPTLIKKKEYPEAPAVLSQKTVEKMRKLLRLVVAEGTGKSANAPGYLVGGKTGTAEKTGGRRYDKKRLVSSFVGAFPMNDPKYIILILLDEPKGIKETWGYATAGWTAAPTARRVIERIAPILGIAPVDEDSKEIHDLLYVDFPRQEKKG